MIFTHSFYIWLKTSNFPNNDNNTVNALSIWNIILIYSIFVYTVNDSFTNNNKITIKSKENKNWSIT